MSISPHQIAEDNLRRLLYDLEALVRAMQKETAVSPFDKALEALNAGQVVMASTVSITVPVSSTTPPPGVAPGPTFLIENKTLNLMQVMITNDDAAIALYLGDKDVVVSAGELVEPRQTIIRWLRRGQRKFGMAAAGQINVVVSRAESALQAVTTDAVNGELHM